MQNPPAGCSLGTPSQVNTLGCPCAVVKRSRSAALDTASALVYGAPPRLCADVHDRRRRGWKQTNVPDAQCTTLAPLQHCPRPARARLGTRRSYGTRVSIHRPLEVRISTEPLGVAGPATKQRATEGQLMDAT